MPSKYKLTTEMANETLKEITQNGSNWISFLNTASNNYKYSFNEQVLIYAQKPDATACADIETWNRRLKRWVRKGAKGIALISVEDGRNVLRHVFDIDDTYSGIGKEIKLWEVKSSYENGIIETLENSFGNLQTKDTLAEAIFFSTSNLVEDNAQDYLVDLKEVVENSLLEKLDDVGLESYFKGMLVNSVSYMVMKRCNIDPMEHFNLGDFDLIKEFNTKRVLARLGAATSDIAEQELREISSSVRNFEKIKNRTFDKKQENNYYKNENNNEERRNDYDRFNLQTNGGLSNTTSSITKEQENDSREVLKDEREILEGTQKRTIRGVNARGQDGGTLGRDRADSSKEIKTDNNEISREKSSERRVESNRPNEMGTRNEPIQKSSRGNNNGRIDLQLDLFADGYIPQIKELPSVEEQQNNIKREAEIELETIPAFPFTRKMMDSMILEGSHFEQGKFRIYEQFQKSFITKENVDFLKKEYGDGGSSSIRGFEEIGEEHSAKGIKLYKGYAVNRPEILLKWNEIEKRIRELIKLDKYLSVEEKEEYKKYLNEKNNEVNEKPISEMDNLVNQLEEQMSNTSNQEISKSNEEQITKFKIGQIIYLESDRKYRVEAINKALDEIVLLDATMLEEAHYPIMRTESYLRAVSLYNNNERNFIKEEKNKIETKQNETTPKIQQEKIDYHILDNSLGEGTPKEKVKRNIEAIKLLKKLEFEERLATSEEQEVLSKYIGWGGLPDVFDESKTNWSEEYKELKEILTDEEYKSARASTLTAFYTPPLVINAIYQVLQNMGVEQANILEPSCRCR